MTYEEFVNCVQSCVNKNDFKDDYAYAYNHINGVVIVEWETGGSSGGNCWGDESTSYNSDIDEPDQNKGFMADLLLEVAPNISFVHYKQISNMWSDITESRDCEYYGNYVDYNWMTLDIAKVWDYLKENKLV